VPTRFKPFDKNHTQIRANPADLIFRAGSEGPHRPFEDTVNLAVIIVGCGYLETNVLHADTNQKHSFLHLDAFVFYPPDP
jgi:hypothetical protein